MGAIMRNIDAADLYGMWGPVTDPGARTVTAEVAAIPGANVHRSPYRDYDLQDAADDLETAPTNHALAILGSSLGGNNGPELAAAFDGKRTIDFLAGFQPSSYGAHTTVPKNVKVAICIFNPNWIITFGLGDYEWVLAPDNDATIMLSTDDGATWKTTKTGTNGNVLKIVENPDVHPADFDTVLQALVISELKLAAA